MSGATVALVDPGTLQTAAVTVTGVDGRYSLTAPGAGSYLLDVQRVGYRRHRLAGFDVPTEGRAIDHRLEPVALQLEPIEVVAERERVAFLTSVGFYERQKPDFGRCIDRRQIEARRARRFTDLLTMIPGVQLASSLGGMARAEIQLRGSRLSGGGPCHPRVYVDGLIVIRGDARPPRAERATGDVLATERELEEVTRDEIAMDDVAMPDDIEAIEVYRSSSQVPARFGGMGPPTQCGVIVVWTRRGGRS